MICNKCKKNQEDGNLLSSAYGYVCEECAGSMVKCPTCNELVDDIEMEWYRGEYTCYGCIQNIEQYEVERELISYRRII